MASPEIIGTNGISDLGGSLTTSLSSSTIFGSALNDNFALTDLLPQPKAAAATDSLVSYLSTENTTGGDLLQSSQPKAASVSDPTDNVFTKSLLFNQPLSLAATDFSSLSSSTAARISSESDWLTGSTNSTPLVGLTSNNDPLTNPATAGTASNAETSEITATSVSQTTAESPPPDLVVTAATTPATSPTWGKTIAVTWTVTNQGLGIAKAVWNDGFYLSSDAVFDSSDTLIASR